MQVQPAFSNNLTLGAKNISLDSAPILLVANNIAGGGNGYSTFRLAGMGVTAGYQVPAGKTLNIVGIVIQLNVAAAMQSQLSYADTDVGINSQAASGTNPVYLSGMASTLFQYYTPATVGSYPFLAPATVPTGKYLQHQGSNGGAPNAIIFAFGYLS